MTLLAVMQKSEKDFYPFEIDGLLSNLGDINGQSHWLFNTKSRLQLFAGPEELDLESAFDADTFDADAVKKGIKRIDIVNMPKEIIGSTRIEVQRETLQLWQVVQILSVCNDSPYIEYDIIESFELIHSYQVISGEIKNRKLKGVTGLSRTFDRAPRDKVSLLCSNLPHLSQGLIGIDDFAKVRIASSERELPVAMRLWRRNSP